MNLFLKRDFSFKRYNKFIFYCFDCTEIPEFNFSSNITVFVHTQNELPINLASGDISQVTENCVVY